MLGSRTRPRGSLRTRRLARLTVLSAAAVGLLLSVRLFTPSLPELERPAAEETRATVPARDDGAPEPGVALAALPPEPETAVPEPEVSEPPAVLRSVDVKRGDTLFEILLRQGVVPGEAEAAIETLKSAFDPRRLKVGQTISLELLPETDSGDRLQLAALAIELDWDEQLRLSREPGQGFSVERIRLPVEVEHVLVSGEIAASLYEAAAEEGLPLETLFAMVRLFSWDVDFQRDIQPGDRFQVLFTRLRPKGGGEPRAGEILYAALEVGGRQLDAYRFRRSEDVEYFDREGRSLRKSLMRTPINGARLSSPFGKRKHPILGFTRLHKGVDFAAPRGTPIFAAGDGVVTFAGRNGNLGIYVRIRHNAEYVTAYAHMQGIAKGIRRGVRVKQGQVIGYVGSTGMVTGPHLHYEVRYRGRVIDPLSLRQAEAVKLEGAELSRFLEEVARIDALRENLSDEVLVAQNRIHRAGERKPSSGESLR